MLNSTEQVLYWMTSWKKTLIMVAQGAVTVHMVCCMSFAISDGHTHVDKAAPTKQEQAYFKGYWWTVHTILGKRVIQFKTSRNTANVKANWTHPCSPFLLLSIRVHNEVCASCDIASQRMFRGGRTDYIRSPTNQMLKFVLAFDDPTISVRIILRAWHVLWTSGRERSSQLKSGL